MISRKDAKTQSPKMLASVPLASMVSKNLKLIAYGLWLMALSAFASDIHKNEEVLFFPGIGHRVGDGWELEIRGWIYEPKGGALGALLFREMLDLKNKGEDKAGDAIFEKRAKPFLVDNEQGRVISIQVGEKVYAMEKSGENGLFTGHVHVSGGSGPRITFRAVMPHDDPRIFKGEAFLLEDEGLSVISDFDDTIKISQAMDHKLLMKNTFFRPFEPVPGMSEVYRRWSEKKGAAFHYVSASPWQLYAPMKDFMNDEDFPKGTFHLKAVRWKDRSLLKLFESPGDFKRKEIPPILERFPKRGFVLVGDSGQNDPEVYAEMARKFPDQVKLILIRDVTNESPDSDRYKKTFKGLPKELWKIFHDPSEIRDAF